MHSHDYYPWRDGIRRDGCRGCWRVPFARSAVDVAKDQEQELVGNGAQDRTVLESSDRHQREYEVLEPLRS